MPIERDGLSERINPQNICEKQQTKVLCKKICSYKFRKFHRKTPEGLQLYKNETPIQVLSCEICEIFTNTYFAEHLQTAASRRTASKFSRTTL